jgi:predicted CopG family antitoxin
MKKKLTLTIDEEVTEQAKRLAKRENTSVSEIVEQYLVKRTSDDLDWKPEKNSITASLLGSVSLPKNQSKQSYKQIKESEILKKYGGKDSR